MNLYELRYTMHVTNFYPHLDGATINYLRGSILGSVTLGKIELFDELVAIGSIDEDITYSEYKVYSLSQWDALNIAIRYEAARDMAKEIDNSDIGKAIDKLK